MLCEKCNAHLKQITTSEEKDTYQCEKCKTTHYYHKKEMKWTVEKRSVTVLKKFGIAEIVILVSLGLILLMCGLAIGGDSGLVVHSVGLTLITLLVLVWGIISKTSFLTITSVITTAAYYTILFLSLNGIPEFIRKIPGAEFISIWHRCELFMCYGALLIQILCALFIILKNRTRFLSYEYSSYDLLCIKKPNRFRLCCYYLLKASLDSIVEIRYPDIVKINSNIDRNDIIEYGEKNPPSKKIIELLLKTKTKAKRISKKKRKLIVTKEKTTTSIERVLEVASIDISDSFDKSDTPYDKVKDKLFFTYLAIDILTAIPVFFMGISKLFMGIHFNKEVSDLVTYGFLFSLINFLIFLAISYLFYILLFKFIVDKPIIRKIRKAVCDANNNADNIFSCEIVPTEKEKEDILIYFLTHNGKSPQSSIIYECERSIISLEKKEKAEKRRQRSSSDHSYCSSCSSCGGGCSGCGGGGCGGCGD